MPHLDRDGARVVYEVTGPAGAPVVLCVHNLLTDRAIFAGVAERLRERARVVLVDLRGHGESRATRAFSVGDLALDLLAVLDAAGAPRAVVAGVSLGAAAALELTLRAPERVGGLLLMGTNPHASTLRDAVENTLLGAVVRTFGWPGFVLRTARDVLFGRTFQAERPAELAERLRRVAAIPPREAWFGVRCWVGRRAVLGELARLRAPTIVVAGEEDVPSPPALAEATHRAIPGAVLERLRSGHTAPLERPDEVARLVERLISPPMPAT